MKYDNKYWFDVERVIKHIPEIEKLYNTSILITGGSGLICSAVADILFYLNQNKNASIKIFLAGRSRKRVEERFEGIDKEAYSYVQYDATMENELNLQVDYIIHGASNANPVVYTKQPVETMLANILGVNNMLRMASEMNTKRVLYVSSSEVYGNKDDAMPYSEKDYGYVDILNSRAAYPSAKRAAETLCVSYSMEHDVDTVIVRPGHIYGPSITQTDSRASAQFTRNAVNGENIVMKSKGMQLRSYCYSLDCASAILTVLTNGEKCRAYNISNKNSICTISEIAQALASAVNREVIYEEANEEEKKGYNLMTNSSLDATLLEELGWSAEFSLEEGTRRTIEILKLIEE